MLAGSAPLYGGRRDVSPLYHHAMINHSNIEGACCFVGGTQQIADALARRIRTAVDFQRDQPAVYLWAGFSLRLGQAVSLAVRILVQCLGVLARHRQTQKEAV